jgi:hypothetical protein
MEIQSTLDIVSSIYFSVGLWLSGFCASVCHERKSNWKEVLVSCVSMALLWPIVLTVFGNKEPK